MIGLKNADILMVDVVDELRNIISQWRGWALVEHNEDGTHRASPAVTNFVPTATIVQYAGSSAPSNWFLCDGAQVSRVTYKRLFDVIGTTYGAGDGSTTFNLPDLRGRFPLGKAASGTGSILGGTGGAIDHVHTGPSHTHAAGTLAGPAHTHSIASGGGHTHTGGAHTHAAGTLAGPSHTHTMSGSTANESSHTHAAGTFAGPSHTHTFSGTTDVNSAKRQVDIGALWVADDLHTHDFSGTTAAGGTGAVTGTSAAGSAHSHGIGTIATGAGGTGSVTGSTASDGAVVTSSDGAHDHGAATGSSGTGSVTGSTAADGTGNTGTANPPFISLNYIIKD